MSKIAFIGLGVMGFPMARHLSHAGHDVCVYNRTQSKAELWCEQYGGQWGKTPAEASKDAGFVFACVGNDSDLRDVTCGEQGAFAGMTEGSLFVDHTTASARISRELSCIALEKGIGYLDAPVSGGQQGAENGLLTVMVGGDTGDFKRAEPVIASYARQVTLLGPPGSGQLCKMVNQICVAGLIEALAEGLHFARASGLNPEQVINVISKGAAQSWQMDNRYRTMLAGEYNHGFAVDWMRKDLDIVLDEAANNGSHLPVTELVNTYYAEVQAMGGGRWDTSSLLARLEVDSKSN
ncbi:NAD(P)-dependent oxidoreductase [Porticoccus sp.]